MAYQTQMSYILRRVQTMKKNNKTKKIAALLSATLITSSFIGCDGSDDKDSKSTSEPSTITVPSSPSEENTTNKDEVTTDTAETTTENFEDIAVVYGPPFPSDIDNTTSNDEQQETSEAPIPENTDVTEEEIPCVYGPPIGLD